MASIDLTAVKYEIRKCQGHQLTIPWPFSPSSSSLVALPDGFELESDSISCNHQTTPLLEQSRPTTEHPGESPRRNAG